MKGIWIIALMLFLNHGLSKAADPAESNNPPGQVRNLLDAQGFTFEQEAFSLPRQNTNSLRNLQFIERGPFVPLVVPAKKPGWSLWNNSSFKSIGNNYEQVSVLAPYAALAQYEYDISYSLDF